MAGMSWGGIRYENTSSPPPNPKQIHTPNTFPHARNALAHMSKRCTFASASVQVGGGKTILMVTTRCRGLKRTIRSHPLAARTKGGV